MQGSAGLILPAPDVGVGLERGLPAWRALARSAAICLRSGFVYVECAAAQVCAIQGFDGSVSFCLVGHLDESETSRSARVAVRDQTDTFYGSIWLEERPDRFFGGAEIQVTNKNILHTSLLVI